MIELIIKSITTAALLRKKREPKDSLHDVYIIYTIVQLLTNLILD